MQQNDDDNQPLVDPGDWDDGLADATHAWTEEDDAEALQASTQRIVEHVLVAQAEMRQLAERGLTKGARYKHLQAFIEPYVYRRDS